MFHLIEQEIQFEEKTARIKRGRGRTGARM
jgi:hypothetical protein